MLEYIFIPINIVYLALLAFGIGIGAYALAGSKKH